MHSVSEPASEAQALYIDQSSLGDKLKRETGEELVIWDVGRGAATNAMAAIHCHEKARASGEKLRPLKIVSFENDLDSLRLALLHPLKFSYLKHAAPVQLLKSGEWRSKDCGIFWQVLEGDFREKFREAPKPDVIFYDPFSYKTDSELWGLECFKKIAEFLGDQPVELYTYSASTRARAALLVAGFFVARGLGSGPKEETTAAFLNLTKFTSPVLSRDWLTRWERSQAQVPSGIQDVQEIAEFMKKVRLHPQFASAQ
jgi:queuine tRNA-ribosyltransferase